MSRPFLPYGKQEIDDADISAVVTALKSDFLTTGPLVDSFERALEQAVGAPHAVVCSNGTAALHLAALSMDFTPGDPVIVPALTFAATANAIRYVDGEVVFCDVDPATGLATPATVEAAWRRSGKAAKALFVVHLNGQSADVAALCRFAEARGLRIVEDACHAIGGTSQDVNGDDVAIGSCHDSDLAVFSFHPVKTITAGEGGAVTSRDPRIADRLRRLRSHGITREVAAFAMPEQAFDSDGAENPWYHEMQELGFNYRITDVQCALGISQLRRLQSRIARREALAQRYDRGFANLAPVLTPIKRAGHGTPAWHLYVVLIDFASLGRSRARIMGALKQKGVGTQVHYLPVNRHPYYVARYGASSFKGADAYYERCLSLPLFPSMTDDDVDAVIEALSDVLR